MINTTNYKKPFKEDDEPLDLERYIDKEKAKEELREALAEIMLLIKLEEEIKEIKDIIEENAIPIMIAPRPRIIIRKTKLDTSVNPELVKKLKEITREHTNKKKMRIDWETE